MLTDEDGAAPLDAVVGIVILMFVALAAIQIALTVYAQNAVRSSAYEAARVAAEVGASREEAHLVAVRALTRTAGKLVDKVHVSLSRGAALEGPVIRVDITARQRALAPVPISLPIHVSVTSLLEVPPSR